MSASEARRRLAELAARHGLRARRRHERGADARRPRADGGERRRRPDGAHGLDGRLAARAGDRSAPPRPGGALGHHRCRAVRGRGPRRVGRPAIGAATRPSRRSSRVRRRARRAHRPLRDRHRLPRRAPRAARGAGRRPAGVGDRRRATSPTSTTGRWPSAHSPRAPASAGSARTRTCSPTSAPAPGSSSARSSPRPSCRPTRRCARRCGVCTRCLSGCPTGALVAPRTIDARRCISYLTIEHPGVLDPWEAAAIGDWIFGCDVCQEVCPVNADADDPGPLPRPAAAAHRVAPPDG